MNGLGEIIIKTCTYLHLIISYTHIFNSKPCDKYIGYTQWRVLFFNFLISILYFCDLWVKKLFSFIVQKKYYYLFWLLNIISI